MTEPMTTRARHRAAARDLFAWSRGWSIGGRSSVHAAISGRQLPGFEELPDSPYGSGNVGLNVGDDPADVERRRAALARRAGATRLIIANQVHGAEVAVVTEQTLETPTADALVTAQPNLMLGVTVADCVPVMLVDLGSGIVGVAHAGRKGMAAKVVTATLDAMADLGAEVVVAVVGPSICARCYEVSEQVRAEVAVAAPLTPSVTRTGTPSIDVVAGVLDELAPRTIGIELLAGCTAESPDLFSHRASGGTAGRFAGYVWRCHPHDDDVELG